MTAQAGQSQHKRAIAQGGKPGSGSITMDALWKAIEMEKAKARDPSLSKIERAETLRVSHA